MKALAMSLATAGLASLCLGPAIVSAADFPNITLTPSQGGVGTIVRVDGTNFCSSGCPSTITISFSRIPVATVSEVNGAFRTTFQVPGGQSYGPHDVEADQSTPNGVISAHRSFLVTISQTAPPTVSPSPKSSPFPSASPGSPSAAPSPGASPEPSATSSQPINAPVQAVAGQVAGAPVMVILLAVLLLAAVGVAGYVWWRRRASGP
jgi:cobalamin biosynthesis Mg chelatase CobN